MMILFIWWFFGFYDDFDDYFLGGIFDNFYDEHDNILDWAGPGRGEEVRQWLQKHKEVAHL